MELSPWEWLKDAVAARIGQEDMTTIFDEYNHRLRVKYEVDRAVVAALELPALEAELLLHAPGSTAYRRVLRKIEHRRRVLQNSETVSSS